MRLILASASPRRAELLGAAGFEFDIVPADVDETVRPGEAAGPYALRVARDKALAVERRCRETGSVVLGADTVVVVDGAILGKPDGAEDARAMLRRLSGRTHEVHTGVAVLAAGREIAELATTRVEFLPLTEPEIEWYVGTGEPEGKAGAYAIQGRASRFIHRIEGSWANVVGLPIAAVYRILCGAGVVC